MSRLGGKPVQLTEDICTVPGRLLKHGLLSVSVLAGIHWSVRGVGFWKLTCAVTSPDAYLDWKRRRFGR